MVVVVVVVVVRGCHHDHHQQQQQDQPPVPLNLKRMYLRCILCILIYRGVKNSNALIPSDCCSAHPASLVGQLLVLCDDGKNKY